MALQRQPTSVPENDIYTVLLIVATIFVIIATVCLFWQFNNYYGLENLFHGPAEIK